MKDPIEQATNQHHHEQAELQRRAETMTEEIYADITEHLDEVVGHMKPEVIKELLLAYLLPRRTEVLDTHIAQVVTVLDGALAASVKAIVDDKL